MGMAVWLECNKTQKFVYLMVLARNIHCSTQMGVLGFVVFSNGVHPLLCFKPWQCLPLLLSFCDARRVPLFPQLKIVDFTVVDGS